VDIRSRVGNQIKELREKSEISQKELSFLSDLDRSYIASVESGKRNISIVNLEKIANALGIKLGELLKDL
jgi:transcriptional regulator with XRE-family HTH domain